MDRRLRSQLRVGVTRDRGSYIESAKRLGRCSRQSRLNLGLRLVEPELLQLLRPGSKGSKNRGHFEGLCLFVA